MNERTHIDLCSGIGGFALAAKANGIRTTTFCEIDERCRSFLAKAWPGVPCHEDLRTFDGRLHRGAFLLTAGIPCQPASRAGKQRGAKDDRWLWDEFIRVLDESRPTWALPENPLGINDVGLDGILSDVERCGYEVQPICIPACAVDSPHGRDRYWIICRRVADTDEQRRQRTDAEPGTHGLRAEHREGDMADTASARHTKSGEGPNAHGNGAGSVSQRGFSERKPAAASGGDGFWSSYVWLPCADGKLRRAPDDSFGLVNGLHRSVLAALGNSIVPQVAEEIIAAMIEAERATCA